MSLQLGLGSVRDPRASIAAMPTTEPTNRRSGKRLLAFGTLFSCQGAQSSHTGCQAGRRSLGSLPRYIRQSRWTRDKPLTAWWGTREVIPRPDANSNDIGML